MGRKEQDYPKGRIDLFQLQSESIKTSREKQREVDKKEKRLPHRERLNSLRRTSGRKDEQRQTSINRSKKREAEEMIESYLHSKTLLE